MEQGYLPDNAFDVPIGIQVTIRIRILILILILISIKAVNRQPILILILNCGSSALCPHPLNIGFHRLKLGLSVGLGVMPGLVQMNLRRLL